MDRTEITRQRDKTLVNVLVYYYTSSIYRPHTASTNAWYNDVQNFIVLTDLR